MVFHQGMDGINQILEITNYGLQKIARLQRSELIHRVSSSTKGTNVGPDGKYIYLPTKFSNYRGKLSRYNPSKKLKQILQQKGHFNDYYRFSIKNELEDVGIKVDTLTEKTYADLVRDYEKKRKQADLQRKNKQKMAKARFSEKWQVKTWKISGGQLVANSTVDKFKAADQDKKVQSEYPTLPELGICGIVAPDCNLSAGGGAHDMLQSTIMDKTVKTVKTLEPKRQRYPQNLKLKPKLICSKKREKAKPLKDSRVDVCVEVRFNEETNKDSSAAACLTPRETFAIRNNMKGLKVHVKDQYRKKDGLLYMHMFFKVPAGKCRLHGDEFKLVNHPKNPDKTDLYLFEEVQIVDPSSVIFEVSQPPKHSFCPEILVPEKYSNLFLWGKHYQQEK